MSHSVLLIEAVDGNHYPLAPYIEKIAQHFSIVSNVQQAVHLQTANRFDIILFNINGLKFNNSAALRAISTQFYPSPVVVFAEEETEQLVENCFSNGVCDFITLPVTPSKLPLIVNRNIRRRKYELNNESTQRNKLILKVLTALMRALDAKDHNTSEHAQRVVNYSLLMARELELTGEQTVTLQLAAYLHDIGKIGMPDSILKKDSGLLDMEIGMSRQHPVVGSEIIGEIEELREVAFIIRHHHERYDGKGYPDGLQGEQIPLFSRILSIIDSYEAMVSDRVYRRAMPHQAAMEELHKNTGTQFDAELVHIFEKISPSFDLIRKKTTVNIQAQQEHIFNKWVCLIPEIM